MSSLPVVAKPFLEPVKAFTHIKQQRTVLLPNKNLDALVKNKANASGSVQPSAHGHI